VSIYCSFAIFDGEEDGWPAPLIYRQSHILPSDDDPRGGSLDLGSIPRWITRDGRCVLGRDAQTCCTNSSDRNIPSCEEEGGGPNWPWLRVSLRPTEPGEDTVVLDRGQVEKLRDELTWWLGTLP
jgi:hypothetical protein